MLDQSPKMAQHASPPVRTGAGDISERELSREWYSLSTTPTARVQPAHPRKQVHSVPVSKFGRGQAPGRNLHRIRSCLEELSKPPPPPRVAHKAASLEDLTPSKKLAKRRKEAEGAVSGAGRCLGPRVLAEEQAAARVARFMLLAAWRRRRHDLRCLRKTLEVQVSSSERLRVQVWALKSLLEADGGKLRLGLRELQRLKQLLHDRDAEKALLEKEKRALEGDVSAAEDRASEMSIGWRNCRNELEAAGAAARALERALALQLSAQAELAAQRDAATQSVSRLGGEVRRCEALLGALQAEASALCAQLADKQRALDAAALQLHAERQARGRGAGARLRLAARLALAQRAAGQQRAAQARLEAELAQRDHQLVEARARWLPHPLLRLAECARCLLRPRCSFRDVFIWSLLAARRGC
ncbi:PREDICTED: uncharacterized protein LOC106111475 [Papilio polytes]|uniref:uncharacterized protein LOC106111475 n=1 Tax=Papilio polytes TaxID=76194 RepID=UPI0006761097|nr:PREDICTED: uncharacterized protein LOC106111475 [Papilio polytes]